MGVRFYTVVVGSHDPKQLAEWWGQVLDWKIVFEGPDEGGIAKDDDTYPALIFVPIPESKTGRTRLHTALAPDDRDEEVRRIEALGAKRVAVGKPAEAPWVVLADPEGNEF